jgi:hypothetical protein
VAVIEDAVSPWFALVDDAREDDEGKELQRFDSDVYKGMLSTKACKILVSQ